MLSGEGGREGLILIVSRHFNDDPQARWGVIVPSDKVPPTPDKQQLLHDGERDDAGLVALLEFTEQKKSRGNRRPSQQDVHGFIVDGDIPPVPVSASAE